MASILNSDRYSMQQVSTWTLDTADAWTWPSSLVVNTTDDIPNEAGLLSLRSAIEFANAEGGDQTITFASSLTSGGPATINLNGTALTVDDASGTVTIQGPGVDQLAVNAGGYSQVITNNAGSTAAIVGLTITDGENNTVDTGGGAISNDGTLSLADSTISGSSAAFGGGIYNDRGTLTVTDCTITGDSATTLSGGGIYNFYGTATVADCTITGNATWGFGGGLYSYGGTLNVSNSTITGNSADSGGGIHNQVATLTVTDSTISGNAGGGISASGGSSIVDGTIVAANSDGSTHTNDLSGTFHNSTHDLIGDGTGGLPTASSSHNILGTVTVAQDPGLAPLGYYGGTIQTMALLPDSLALNSGAAFNDAAGTPITTDQRGIPRPSNSSDMGAFQLGGSIVAEGTSFSAYAGVPLTATVATLTPIPAISSGNFQATINWGDGTATATGDVELASSSDGTLTVSGTHTYTFSNTYSVTVDVTYFGGVAAATITSQAVVAPETRAGAAMDLTATATLDGSVNLAWLPVNLNETGYLVQRLNFDGTWSTLGSTSTIVNYTELFDTYHFSDTTGASDTAYSYRIQAYTGSATSPTILATSNTFDATTVAANAVPGTTALDTIVVPLKDPSNPSQGEIVTSSITLAAGVQYDLVASGYFDIGNAEAPHEADAQWTEFDSTFGSNQQTGRDLDRTGTAVNLGIGIDDTTVDGNKYPYWGPYNSSHVYSVVITGTGAPITLNYHDSYYPDNFPVAGAPPLSVNIYPLSENSSISGRVYSDDQEGTQPPPNPQAALPLTSLTPNTPLTGYMWGVGYYAPDNSIIAGLSSGNGYADGLSFWSKPAPYDFVEILPDGTTRPFSDVRNLYSEISVAIAQPNNSAGFTTGDLFACNAGAIMKITDGGNTVIPNWVSTPDDSYISGLCFDSSGTFGGNLIVVTNDGSVYLIDAKGDIGLIATISDIHADDDTEACFSMPATSTMYPSIAGDLLVSCDGPGSNQIFAVQANGTVTEYDYPAGARATNGLWMDTMAFVPPDENFYGAYGGLSSESSIMTSPASDLSYLAGSIIVGTHSPGSFYQAPGGIYQLSSLQPPSGTETTGTFSWAQVSPMGDNQGSDGSGNWEQMIFAQGGFQPLNQPSTQPGLSGWPVNLHQIVNGVEGPTEQTTTTDASGSYSFTDLSSGTYVVQEALQWGYVEDLPTTLTYQVTIGQGQSADNLNFANHLPSESTPPVITSPAPQVAFVNHTKTFVVQASDPDGDALVFSLLQGPSDMTLTQQGNNQAVVTWTPSETGFTYVLIGVNDGHGYTAMQPTTINVEYLAAYPVPTPSGLIATANSSSTIDLTWLPPTGFDSQNVTYDIYRGIYYSTSSAPPSLTQIAFGVNATEYVDTGLLPNTVYYYQVRTLDENDLESLPDEYQTNPSAKATTPLMPGPIISSVSVDADPVATAQTYAHATVAWAGGSLSDLTYLWSFEDGPAGAPSPVFDSSNGTDHAKDIEITFGQAGHYRFNVLVSAPTGVFAESQLQVDVVQTLTSVIIDPGAAAPDASVTPPSIAPTYAVLPDGTINLWAIGEDQFNNPMSPAQMFSWKTTDGDFVYPTYNPGEWGSDDPMMMTFEAPPTLERVTIQAESFGSIIGACYINVANPVIAITDVTVTPTEGYTDTSDILRVNTTGTGVNLGTFSYSFVFDSQVPTDGSYDYAPTISQYDSGFSVATVAFHDAGIYTFDVTATDNDTNSPGSSTTTITVDVLEICTGITLTAGTTTLDDSNSDGTISTGLDANGQYTSTVITAQGQDQFGNPMSAPPLSRQWTGPTGSQFSDPSSSSSGTFSILFTAPPSGGGTEEVDCIMENQVATITQSIGIHINDLWSPTAPANVQATPESAEQIVVTWDPVPGAAFYILFRGSPTEGVGGFGEEADDIYNTAYVDQVTPGDSYVFAVYAMDSSYNLSPAGVSGTVTALSLPDAPQNLKAQMVGPSVQLTWDDGRTTNSAIQGWQVYRTSTLGTVNGQVVPIDFIPLVTGDNALDAQPMYTDSDIVSGTTYYYEVEACDQPPSELSDASDVVSITPMIAANAAPAAPTDLVATYCGDGRVGLSWDGEDDPNLLGYDIYRSTVPEFTPDSSTLIGSSAADKLSYTDDGLFAAGPYYYCVLAVTEAGDGSGNEIDSPPARTSGVATGSGTEPNAPGNPSTLTISVVAATDLEAAHLQLNWEDAAYDEAGFEIDERSSTDNGQTFTAWTMVGETTQGQTVFQDFNTPLSSASTITYYYRVAAYNIVTTSPPKLYSADWAVATWALTGDSSVGAAPSVPDAPTLVSEVYDQTVLQIVPADESPVAGVEGYEVFRSTDPTTNGWSELNPGQPAAYGSSGVQYTDAAVDSGTTYQYAVEAVSDDNIASGLSEPLTVTTDAYPSNVAPTTTIDAPAPFTGTGANFVNQTNYDGRIQNITPVMVEVAGNSTVTWSLSLTPVLPAGSSATAQSIQLASGIGPVGAAHNDDGTLVDPNGAQIFALDPTLYPSGNYTLTLSATNSAGTIAFNTLISLYSQVKLGSLTLPVTDATFNIPGGQPITITRVYNSTNANVLGDLGYGWQLTTGSSTITTTAQPDADYDNQVAFRPGDLVYITLPDGEQHAFQFWPVPGGYVDGDPYDGSTYEGGSYSPRFVSVDGSGCTLSVPNVDLTYASPVMTLADGDYAGEAYNPAAMSEQYTLHTPSHDIYTFDAASGSLTSFEDANGNTTTYTNNSIEENGYTISITREAATSNLPPRAVIQLVDSNNMDVGNALVYTYDANGTQLDSFTGLDGKTTVYGYSTYTAGANFLTQVTNSAGVVTLTATYDDLSGRLTSLKDAQENSASIQTGGADGGGSQMTSDLAPSDLTPSQDTTQTIYDSEGNAIRTISAITDPSGDITGYTVTVHQYTYVTPDVVDNIEQVMAGVFPGNALASEQDYAPFVIGGTDSAGLRYSQPPTQLLHEVDFDTDASSPGFGQPLRDATYVGPASSAGDSVFIATIYNNYDSHGQPTSVSQTLETRDANDTLLSSTVISTTTSTYDADGNLTRSTDALGNTTYYTYTSGIAGVPNGLPLETYKVTPGGDPALAADQILLSSNSYYSSSDTSVGAFAGSLKSTTTYTYDASGNASEQVTVYFYDSSGNAAGTYTRAPDENAGDSAQWLWSGTSSVFDADGRVTSTSQAVYLDDDGSLYAMVDESGNVVINTATNPAYQTATSTSTAYNSLGQVSSTTDQYGGQTTSTYDANGNLILTSYPNGTQVRTVYDAMGRVIWQTGPFKPVNSDLASSSNTSLVTHTIYNSLGQAIGTEQYQGVAIELVADANNSGFLTAVAPAVTSASSGQFISATHTWYDAQGRVIEARDAAGLRTGTIYNIDGSVADTGPLNSAAPDGGDVVSGLSTFAFQATDFAFYTQYLYNQVDSSGQLYDEVIDPYGRATDTYKDAAGQVIKTVYDDGSFTQTLYGSNGQTIPGTDNPDASPPAGLVVQPGGQEVVKIAQRKITDPVVATYYVYDAAGNLTDVWLPAVTNANPASSTFGQSVRPHWQYAYDSAGNQVSQTDPNGDATTYAYDAMGNMISRALPDGEKEVWTYNAHGQIVTDKVYDIAGTVAKTTWDVYDNASSSAGRLAAEYRYASDFTPSTSATGLADVITYANSTGYSGKTVYTYDDATSLPSAEQTDQGRIAEVDEYVQTNGTVTQTWFTHTTYDPITGQAATIATPDGTIHYTYDPATGEPAETWVTHGSSAVSNDTVYTYDQLGQLTDVYEVVLNGVRYSTFAGLSGDLPSFTGATPPVTVYTYDAMGNLFSQTLADGVKTLYTYDDLYRLTDLSSTNVATGEAIFTQHYDLLDNGLRADSVDTQYNADGSAYSEVRVNWVYDADGRLTSESETVLNDGTGGVTDANAHAPAAYTDTYAYDLANNRVQEQVENGTGTTTQTIDYTYDADDQLTGETDNATYSTAYTYDAAGNQITKTVTNPTTHATTESDVYTWDLRNRMTGVSSTVNGVTTSTTYAYDSNGVLVSQTTGGTTTYYLNDPQNPTGYSKAVEQSITENATPGRSYVFGLDVIAQSDSTNGTLYLLHDGHGSTRALIDGAGRVVQRYAYDAFGDASGFDPATAKTVWLFGGDGVYDPASGFTYQLARWRDGFSFLSSDSTSGSLQDPLSLHRYLYADGDPINASDPTGHYSDEDGRQIERVIQNYYAAQYGGNDVLYGKRTGLGADPLLQPDIFDITRSKWMEIKPLSVYGVTSAIKQYANYSANFGPLGYSPDTTWVPLPQPIQAAGYPLYVFNVRGILFYTDFQLKDLLAIPLIWSFAAQGGAANAALQNELSRLEQIAIESTEDVIGREAAIAVGEESADLAVTETTAVLNGELGVL